MPKGFANIYILVGLAILIVGTGAFYFGKLSNQSTKPSLQPVITSQPQPTNAPTVVSKIVTTLTPNPSSSINRIDWKTYTNTEYKFSFQYPETVEVKEISPVYVTISKKSSNLSSILIFLSKNTEGLSRRDFYVKYSNSKIEDILPYINIKETSVGNAPALRIVQNVGDNKQSTPFTWYVIGSGANIIQIVTNEYVGKFNGKSTDIVESKENNSFYQEILATFKLL